jgi:hypothetical protein
MCSSILKTIGCVFVVSLIVHAQPAPKKIPTGSISGKVTVKGKGVAGVSICARPPQSSGGRPDRALVAETDDQGNYRLSNVALGEYEVMPASAQFALIGFETIKRVLLSEGEAVQNINFALVRGGVITGKVVDAEGRPVIEEMIEIVGVEGPNGQVMVQLNTLSPATDDRGVYRAYGLPPGKYKVAAGADEYRMFGAGSRGVYRQTFYPSAPDASQATTIEVTEGSEATNVDIVLTRRQPTFTVVANLLDADTGQPLTNVRRIGLQKFRDHGNTTTSISVSNRLGEIKIENVTPGKYSLFLNPTAASTGDPSVPVRYLLAEPVSFEVTDRDVTGLVLKATSGATISGVVSFEGEDKAAQNQLRSLLIVARVASETRVASGAANSLVNADGSFTIGGLRPGVVTFGLWSQRSGPSQNVDIARIERDGMAVPQVEIKDREQIKGVRLVLKMRTGRIRGVVKCEDPELLANSSLSVSLKKASEEWGTAIQLDERGRFESPLLAPGVYELSLGFYPRRLSRGMPVPPAKQEVVVNDNQVTEVTLTVELKADIDPKRP